MSSPTKESSSNSNSYPEKRAEIRVRTQPFPVNTVGECVKLYGYSRDISPSGMQVRAFSLCPEWPKAVGEKINIEFSIPGKGINIFCQGKVIWDLVPPNGHENMVIQGIKFLDLHPEAKEGIEKWVGGMTA